MSHPTTPADLEHHFPEDLTRESKEHSVDSRLHDDWALVKNWISGFFIVNFDLNMGQIIEHVYPPYVLDEPSSVLNAAEELTAKEMADVTNLAFPDSTASSKAPTEVIDSLYTFRIRKDDASGFFYGVSFFRQMPDENIDRGYFQKSLVIMSPFPFLKLYTEMAAIIGPLYFDMDIPLLEAACHNIAEWPRPQDCSCGRSPSNWEELPLLGNVLIFDLANALECTLTPLVAPSTGSSSNSRLKIKLKPSKRTEWMKHALFVPNPNGSFRHINPFKCFRPLLGNLWAFWELVITGEPLMVVGSNPVVTSDACMCLLGMIAPLPYKGDYRPFFTVMESDYAYFEERYDHGTLSNVILGVTNPFFIKRFEDFKHILVLGGSEYEDDDSEIAKELLEKKENRIATSFFNYRKGSKEENISKGFSKTKSVIGSRHIARLISKDSPLLSVNKSVLSNLLSDKDDSKSDEDMVVAYEINHTLVSSHFHELTTRFLAPFEFFFKPHWPKGKPSGDNFVNPYLNAPRFPRFDESKFLTKVADLPVAEIQKHFLFKSRPHTSLVELYSKFFKSSNFMPWFSTRREVAAAHLDRKVESLIMNLDIEELLHFLDGESAPKCAQAITELLQKYLELFEDDENKIEFINMVKYHLDRVTEIVVQI